MRQVIDALASFFLLRYARPMLARARVGDIVEWEVGSGIRWRVTALLPKRGEVELTGFQGSPPFQISPLVYSLCCRAGQEKTLPVGRIQAEYLADFRANRASAAARRKTLL